MGSSFINFRDYGFWARDSHIEVWLYLIVQEIDRLESVPDWLKEARDHWHKQVIVGFDGWIHPQLDDYLVSQDKINQVLELSEGVLKRLSEQGEVLSRSYLTSLCLGGGAWRVDGEVEIFVTVGRKFVELLRGELKTDASTSPVF